MKLNSKIFESTSASWEHLCAEVSDFVSTIRKEQLINISTAAAGGMDLGGAGARGTIIVWYWE
jgi:hypothetical protein